MQYDYVTKSGEVFLMLDTLQGHNATHSHAGFYCQARLEWLKDKLEQYKNNAIYLCLHHAPFNTGIQAMDSMRLNAQDSAKLYEALQTHRNIRHLFFGHYHSTMGGKWGDISFSSLKGISHQVKLNFNDTQNVWLDFKNPEYSVILLDNKQEPPTICVHYKDFIFNEKPCIQEPIQQTL